MSLSNIERVRLLNQLKSTIVARNESTSPIKKLGLIREVQKLRALLGMVNQSDTPVAVQKKRDTSGFYTYTENRTRGQRQKDNNAAITLLNEFVSGARTTEQITDADRSILAKYSGNGGNLTTADGKKGSAYEYYTPKPIAQGIWSLMQEMGFKGGRVLDPCAGVGIFAATSPPDAVMDAVELDGISGGINQLINAGIGQSVTISPFEEFAANTPDNTHDAIIANVPFGTNSDRGGNQFKDPLFQKDSLESYFMRRSLTKLKPGGLACFIVPPRVVSGKGGNDQKLRTRLSVLAEFKGAYRLPNKIFGSAHADTIVDVVVFKKHSHSILDTIERLQGTNNDLLREANVLWAEFIDGNYFKGEGKRFVLGEFIKKDSAKFRDVDRVINNDSVQNIAKLLRKFSTDSRINLELLDAAEIPEITYSEGDTLALNGQILTLQNGTWITDAAATVISADKAELLRLVTKINTPLDAINAGVTWVQFRGAVEYLTETCQNRDIPAWAATVFKSLQNNAKAKDMFAAIATGLACKQVHADSGNSGDDLVSLYPELAKAMRKYYRCKTDTSIDANSRAAVKFISIHYRGKKGFSDYWQGKVEEITVDLNTREKLEQTKYINGTLNIDIEKARAIVTADGGKFDPLNDDDWLISADGKTVIAADDFFVGSLAKAQAKLDAEIAKTTDVAIRNKLLHMKDIAHQRANKTNLQRMIFDMRSPMILPQETLQFVQAFISKDASIKQNPLNKKYFVDIDISQKYIIDLESKLKNRIGDYLKNGTVTLGSLDVSPLTQEEALTRLDEMIRRYNTQFNTWVKANPKIMARLQNIANKPENIYFNHVDDRSPMTVEGISPEWKFHGYQNAFARRIARNFGGINSFDVGLGKTATALLSVQYTHNLGLKKKTLFVVPNNVLSNWYKEAVLGEKYKGEEGYKAPVYSSSDDCLFVGLNVDKNGQPIVRSSDYDADLNRIMENRHKKIFMTYEAFLRIRLKTNTIDDYENHLRRVDASYARAVQAAEEEKKKSKLAKVTDVIRGKKDATAAPYLEDLGVDSIVIDECHAFKNSKEVVDFKGGKFLSTPMASSMGLDAQAKAWYIRQKNNGAGVLGLTATPLTNSPLEIYSMATLTEGEERVNSIMLGASGSDAFLDTVCDFSEEQEMSITGQMKSYRTFNGLRNLSALRSMIKDVAVIEDAESVGSDFFLPSADEQQTEIVLPDDTSKRLYEYKIAYTVAKEKVFAAKTSGISKVSAEDEEIFNRIQKETGEPVELMAAPFNLINKMNNLIVDPDLDRQATFYFTDNKTLAEKVCTEFNNKKMKEKRTRLGRFTKREDVLKESVLRNEDKEIIAIEYTVQVVARYDGERIILDSDEFNIQMAFEAVMDKFELDVDMSIPPKMAALIENIKTEMANPRGVDGQRRSQKAVKQIIFCDMLSSHTKIKRLLVKHCGIQAGKITFISGQYNSQPDEILEVQEGFNAGDDANKYQIIIANKKAEVGINLQKGCQAIHHLTIGWTPDSLHQRNGRGVRQGNLTTKVNIYFYDADGTFDTYRRRLVNKKSDWINTLLKDENSDQVTVTGGLTREQQDALISMVGDKTAMATFQERIDEVARTKRIAQTRYNQDVNLKTYQQTARFLKDNEELNNFGQIYIEQLYSVHHAVKDTFDAKDKAEKKGASAATIERHQKKLSELLKQRQQLLKQVLEAYTYTHKSDELFISEITESGRHSYIDKHGFKLREVDDSWIKREWLNQLETNRRMNQVAQDELDKSVSREGSYTKDTLDSAKNEQSVRYDGAMIGVGGLIKFCDASENISYRLVCLSEKKSLILRHFNKARPGNESVTSVHSFFHSSMNTDDIVAMIEKNGEGYQEALQYLAEHDQACLAINHNAINANCDYAFKYIPELAALLPQQDLRYELNPMKYMLNVAGVFPYIFNPDNIEAFASSDTIKQWEFVAKSQKQYAEYKGNVLLTSNMDVFSATSIEDFSKQLFNNLRKYNLKFKTYDMEINYFYPLILRTSKYFFQADKERANRIVNNIHQAETMEQATVTANSWLTELMGDVIEILPDFDSFSTQNEYLKELEYQPIKTAYEQARERFKITSPEDYVYMTGDTLKAKKSLDEQGDSFRLIATRADSEIGWRNKFGKGRNSDQSVIKKVTLAPNNVWIFQRKMWHYLQENYASLIVEFNLDVKEGN
jgi:hypothetical protein